MEKYLWRIFFFQKSPLWNCLLLENEQFLVAAESRYALFKKAVLESMCK